MCFTYSNYTPAAKKRGYTVLALSVLPSVTNIFSHTFLSNHASHLFQTWYGASATGPPVVYFLFPGSIYIWTMHLKIAGGYTLVVKQFTDIPINRGMFKENTETGSNFTLPVFLQYVISSLMHQKVWFSQTILREINCILTYRKISKSEHRFSFFPPLVVLYVCHTIYPRTPIDTSRRPLTPQDAFFKVIVFYMINYQEVITFLVCIKVSHRRTYKFYNSY